MMMHLRRTFSGKIGYVCKRYPRFSETFIVHEILAHERAGQEVEIFALRPVLETHFQDILSRVRAPVRRIEDKKPSGEKVWSLLDEAETRFPGAAQRALACGSGASAVAQGLQLALEADRAGVTHLHAHFGTLATTVARIASAVSGIPYSFTAHAKDIYYRYDTSVNLHVKLRDAAFSVTVSDFNRAHLIAEMGAEPERLHRIYNGLDLGDFPWSSPDPRRTDILAVGRLVEKKGFHILVEALMRLKDRGIAPRCRIIGMGEEEDNLRRQIDASGLAGQVIIEGPRPQAEVKKAMAEAAMLVVPCVVARDGNRDGLPTVLLEAMALGTPCISTNVVGIPELVRDGETGLLVPEGCPDGLADAIDRMSANADLREIVSRQGRMLIEAEFDIDRNAATLRERIAGCAVTADAPIQGAA
jgi:glycosyltransferase involved in cell wall biosynthesis